MEIHNQGEINMQVKLSQIVNALEMANDEFVFYYNLQENEIVSVQEEYFQKIDIEDLSDYQDFEQDDIKLAQDIFYKDDFYIKLPDQYEIHEYHIMEDFCYLLEDDKKEHFLVTIKGRGAFRRFKELLYQYGIEKRYYQYREDRFYLIAQNWCEENNLHYIDDRKKTDNWLIETERLYFRKFQVTDWEDLYEYLRLSEVVEFEPYEVFSKEACIEEAKERAYMDCFYAVCLKTSDKMIGHLYFEQLQPYEYNTYTIGYVFNPVYSKQGYATEATKGLIDYGFKKKSIHRIIANCNVLNINSWELLERIGMRREAHMQKKSFFKKDEKGNPIWQDVYQYAILNKEWILK